jgi:hypothetical protein
MNYQVSSNTDSSYLFSEKECNLTSKDGLELTTNRAPSWADKPVEVNRYWQILETRKCLKEALGREVYLQDDIYKTISTRFQEVVSGSLADYRNSVLW